MSKTFSSWKKIVVPAGGNWPVNISGVILKIRSVSGVSFPNLTVSFDGDEDNPIEEGEKYNLTQSGGSFSTLNFKNADPNNDATVVFQCGTIVVDFQPTTLKEYSTYVKGNLGIASAADITALFSAYIRSISNIPNRGQNYKVGDIMTSVAGVFTTAMQILVKTIGTNGSIQQTSILNAGQYTVIPANPVAMIGGSGGGGVTINFAWINAVAGLSYVAPNLRLAANSFLPVIGIDQTNRRKQIVLTCAAGSATSLLVQDVNGKTFDVILAGQTKTYFTDGTLILTPSTATTCDFSVGEVYYNL